MEFQRERVYSAVNADELRVGDKVIVADNLADLKKRVRKGYGIRPLEKVFDETDGIRFKVEAIDPSDGFLFYSLAYLVERKENCTNCIHYTEVCLDCLKGKNHRCYKYKSEPETEPEVDEICVNCEYSSCGYCNINEERYLEVYCKRHDKPTRYDNTCPDYCLKIEQKAEKHTDCNHCEEARKAYACAMTNACPNKYYRPFKDVDELVKVWCEKCPAHNHRERGLTMPLIWVRYKMNQCGQMGILITKYEKNYVQIEGDMIAMHALMADYEFLDGSPCGVEE